MENEIEIDPRAKKILADTGRRKNILLGIIALVILVLGIPVVLVLNEVRASSAYLKECTTPSSETETHGCYEESQKRTKEILRALFDNQAYNRDLIICVLFVPTEERDEPAKQKCEREARSQVEEGIEP